MHLVEKTNDIDWTCQSGDIIYFKHSKSRFFFLFCLSVALNVSRESEQLVIVDLENKKKINVFVTMEALKMYFKLSVSQQKYLVIFNHYSSSPNEFWVNMFWVYEGERNNNYYCFSKIQLVGQKYRDKTALAS